MNELRKQNQSNVIIEAVNQSSISKLNTEKKSRNKLLNEEAKRVASFECKPTSFDDVFLDKTKSDEKETETKYKKKTPQEMSSSLQDTTRKDNRNPNTTNLTASSSTVKCIRDSSYDERKTSDTIVNRKKSSVAKNMCGGGLKCT